MKKLNTANRKGDPKSSMGSSPATESKKSFKDRLDPEWIKSSLSKEAVLYAEELGRELKKESMTTTQIRNFFGEVKRIRSKGFANAHSDFLLLRPKLHYAAKRGEHNKGAHLFKDVFDKAHACVEDDSDTASEQFDRFVQLLEATLAFHRAAGGK